MVCCGWIWFTLFVWVWVDLRWFAIMLCGFRLLFIDLLFEVFDWLLWT